MIKDTTYVNVCIFGRTLITNVLLIRLRIFTGSGKKENYQSDYDRNVSIGLYTYLSQHCINFTTRYIQSVSKLSNAFLIDFLIYLEIIFSH